MRRPFDLLRIMDIESPVKVMICVQCKEFQLQNAKCEKCGGPLEDAEFWRWKKEKDSRRLRLDR